MNKKKKILLIILFSLVFILLAFLFCYIYYFNKEIDLNLDDIDSKFIASGQFNLSNMKNIDKEYISSTLGIDTTYIDEYIGKVPILNVSSSMYVVIEARSKSDVEIIIEKLKIFVNDYQNEWDNFLLSQYNIINNNKIGIKGNYIYLIISENSEELEKLFK